MDDQGIRVYELGQRLGVTTNNVAEYSAVLAALSWLLGNKENLPKNIPVTMRLDSQLVTNQINGIFKVKDQRLGELLYAIRQKQAVLKEHGFVLTFTHIPREQNKVADRMVNLALDGKVEDPA